MIITRYANVSNGQHYAGELYEMQGEQFELLPSELVATYNRNEKDTPISPDNYRVFVLDHINEDGTKAFFRQIGDHNYLLDYTLNIFFTPFDPPREEYIPA